MLADANGLGGDDALVAGSTLTVPEVKTSLNDASTFKPYDPGEITGPTTPGLPYLPPPDQGCGAIGQIIMIVVAIVVTVYTAGAAATALGASTGTVMSTGASVLAGATSLSTTAAMGIAAGSAFVGSVASQALGSMMGVTSFSWRSAASSGLAAGLTAGIGKLGLLGKVTGKMGAFGETAFGQGVVSGISSNLVRQATDRIAGVDTSFSWKSVAISAVSAGIGNSVSKWAVGAFDIDLTTAAGQMTRDFIGGATGGLVSHHLRRQVGLDKGANYGMVLADAFGTMLANRMTGQHAMQALASRQEKALRDDVAAVMEGGPWDLRASAGPDMLSTDSPAEWQRFGLTDMDWTFKREAFEATALLLDERANVAQEIYQYFDASIADRRHVKASFDENYDRLNVGMKGVVILGDYTNGTIDGVVGIMGLLKDGFLEFASSEYAKYGVNGLPLWSMEKGQEVADSLKPVFELARDALSHEEIGPRIVDYAFDYWETMPREEKIAFGGAFVADVALTLVSGYGAAKLAERSLRFADATADAADSAHELTALGKKVKQLIEMDRQLAIHDSVPPLNRIGPHGRTLDQELAGIRGLADPTAGMLRTTLVQRVNDRLPINSKRYAGRTVPLEDLPADLRARYPHSVPFSEAGFPDFSRYSIRNVRIELGPRRDIDFLRADRAAGFTRANPRPSDYTWHHHQDAGYMQLIPTDLHNAIKHTGGVATGR